MDARPRTPGDTLIGIQTPQFAALARALPDALRPGWLVRAWDGAHGTAALEVFANDVRSTVQLADDGISGTATMRGDVWWGAEQVGEVTRQSTLHGSDAGAAAGRLEMRHSYLKLRPDAQGTGFARELNRQSFERYAAAGVDDVTVHAGLEVGGYAWARQGFELVTPGTDDLTRAQERGRIIREMVDEAWMHSAFSDEAYAALAPRLYRGGDVTPDALTSMRDLAAVPEIGPAVLLGSTWHGVLPIERTASWWNGRVPAGVAAAADGASYLTRPAAVGSASTAAARGVQSLLPDTFDPGRVGAVFERHLASVGEGAVVDARRGATELRSFGLSDSVDEVATAVTLPLRDGTDVAVHVIATGPGRQHGAEQLPDAVRASSAAMRSVDDAWRELGVTHVADDLDGKSIRTVSAS